MATMSTLIKSASKEKDLGSSIGTVAVQNPNSSLRLSIQIPSSQTTALSQNMPTSATNVVVDSLGMTPKASVFFWGEKKCFLETEREIRQFDY